MTKPDDSVLRDYYLMQRAEERAKKEDEEIVSQGLEGTDYSEEDKKAILEAISKRGM